MTVLSRAKGVITRLSLGFIATALLVLVGATMVNAQANTNIKAEVCSTASVPAVNVTTPQSDSTTNEVQISLSGTTQRTTQIDISINGVYSQSIAIDSSNAFSTPITLNSGTNTIELNAYYSCNQQSSISNIVVTYEPNTTPGNGGDSNTAVLPPGAIVPGVISNPENSDANEVQQTLPERIKENLGIDGENPPSSFYKDYVIPVRSWLSLLLGFLFAVVVVMPPYHLAWLFNAFGWKNKISKRQQTIFRFIAALLAMLFATILQL